MLFVILLLYYKISITAFKKTFNEKTTLNMKGKSKYLDIWKIRVKKIFLLYFKYT